jgi:hypothetical protein
MKLINKNNAPDANGTSGCLNCGTSLPTIPTTSNRTTLQYGTTQKSANKALPSGVQCPAVGQLFQFAAYTPGTANGGNGIAIWESGVLPLAQAELALANFLNPPILQTPPAQYEVLRFNYCTSGSSTATVSDVFNLGCTQNTPTPPPPPPPNPCGTNQNCSNIVCADGQPAECVNGNCLCRCDCANPQCNQGDSCQQNPINGQCYCVPCAVGQCYNFITHQCEQCPCSTNADCVNMVCPNGGTAVCVNGECQCPCSTNADCANLVCSNGITPICVNGECQCGCSTNADCANVICPNGGTAICNNGVCLCPCDCAAPDCPQGSSCQQNPANSQCFCVPCGVGMTYNFTTNQCEPNPCNNGATPIVVGNNAYCPCNCDAPTQCDPLTQQCVTNPANANECICVPKCEAGQVFNPVLGICQTPCSTQLYDPRFNYTLYDGFILLQPFPVVNFTTGEFAQGFKLIATNTTNPSIAPIEWNFPPDASSPLAGPPYYIPLATGNWVINIVNITFDSQNSNCAIPTITLAINDVQPGNCCTPISFSGIYSPNEVYRDIKIKKASNNGFTKGNIDFYTVVEPDRISAYLLNDITQPAILMSRGPFVGDPNRRSCTSNTGYSIANSEFSSGYWHNANQVGNTATSFIYDNTTANIGNGGSGVAPATHPFASYPNVGKGTLYYEVADAEFDANDEAIIRIGVLPHRCRLTTVWGVQPNCEIVNCQTCGTTLPLDQCTPVNCDAPTINTCIANVYQFPENPVLVEQGNFTPDFTLTNMLSGQQYSYSGTPDIESIAQWLDNGQFLGLPTGERWTVVTINNDKSLQLVTCDLVPSYWNLTTFQDHDRIIANDFDTWGYGLTLQKVIKLTAIAGNNCPTIDNLLWSWNAAEAIGTNPTKNPLYLSPQVITPIEVTVQVEACGCTAETTTNVLIPTSQPLTKQDLTLKGGIKCNNATLGTPMHYEVTYEVTNNGPDIMPIGSVLHIDSLSLPTPTVGTPTCDFGTVARVNDKLTVTLTQALPVGQVATVVYKGEGDCSNALNIASSVTPEPPAYDPDMFNNMAQLGYTPAPLLTGNLATNIKGLGYSAGVFALTGSVNYRSGDTLPVGSQIKVLIANVPTANILMNVTSGNATFSNLGNLFTFTLTQPLDAANPSLAFQYHADHNGDPLPLIGVQITSFPAGYTDTNPLDNEVISNYP